MKPGIRLTHWIKGDKTAKDVYNASLLLSNKIGGYLYLANKPTSRHQGFFFNEDFRMFKLLESIRLPMEITEITNKFSSIVREYGKRISEEYTLPTGFNSFIYEVSGYNGQLGIDLDCRESSDNDDWGRFYNIAIEKDRIIINYEKQSSYRLYLVITGRNLKAEKVKEWKKTEYELDKARNSEFMANVFTALNLFAEEDTKLVFTASTDKDKAVKEGDYVFRNINKLKRKQLNSLIYKYIPGNKDKRIAYNAALNSLNSLLVNINKNSGLFSGLPWLFQFWARDELISLNALPKKEAAEIMSKYFSLVEDSGAIPSRHPHLSHESIDALGWLYLRSKSKDKLENALKSLKEKSENTDGFVVNKPKETWMDTIERSGVRLEVQCLKLNMLKLSGNAEAEKEFLAKARKEFWNGKILFDGIGDAALRPNIFLAYYTYPELLSADEWKKCFRNMVPNLWLQWGGISTLGRKAKSFSKMHTGDNTKSHHGGDSWFFMNNLAAYCMLNVDKKRFKRNVDKILDSSTNDILWHGINGHHSELSSSLKQSSEGCLCKALSSAMFVELVNAL